MLEDSEIRVKRERQLALKRVSNRRWRAANVEKVRKRNREYMRDYNRRPNVVARQREWQTKKNAQVARLLDIFNRSWPHLIEFERVTECAPDRERIAEVILEVATGSADEVHILAKRVVDKFCGAT